MLHTTQLGISFFFGLSLTFRYFAYLIGVCYNLTTIYLEGQMGFISLYLTYYFDPALTCDTVLLIVTMGDEVETGVQYNIQAAQQEQTTDTDVSLQISNDELQGLMAVIKESKTKGITEIDNRQNNEFNIRQKIRRIQ